MVLFLKVSDEVLRKVLFGLRKLVSGEELF